MFDQIAYAMAPGQGGQQGFGMFLPLILLFAIFYFLLIRPQQKRQREHKQLLANLRKGDQVITAGGLYGRITGLTDTVVTLVGGNRKSEGQGGQEPNLHQTRLTTGSLQIGDFPSTAQGNEKEILNDNVRNNLHRPSRFG